ncbi:permease [Amycolatopsis acidicola]|uniref:Permease n=1 Tax=Amycolatopsis acidicola TaxID=2596893 RepID=A0A5N0V3G3_9PSEU|nr:permease [Amycolatopsis acidicola]
MSVPAGIIGRVEVTTEPPREEQAPPRRRRITSIEVLCALLVVAILAQSWLQDVLDVPALRTGSTVFVAVCVQALPFLVLGVLISGAIAAFVPARVLRKVLPRNTSAAVGVAGLAGVALPGCECASVPVARRLIGQGVAPAAALTFLLAAPAVNPVVLVATAVAFPGKPEMVLARFLGSLATAVVMGLLWARWGKLDWIVRRALERMPDAEGGRWRVFAETARTDLVESGGFLVLGALISAALGVLVPQSWFDVLGGQLVLGVLVMAVLAVVLALCSEADAFVAASLTALPLLPKLVFLVVGPAVDVKLFALHAGTFGRRFAVRFAPVTFVVAVCCAVAVGAVLIGGAR